MSIDIVIFLFIFTQIKFKLHASPFSFSVKYKVLWYDARHRLQLLYDVVLHYAFSFSWFPLAYK